MWQKDNISFKLNKWMACLKLNITLYEILFDILNMILKLNESTLNKITALITLSKIF